MKNLLLLLVAGLLSAQNTPSHTAAVSWVDKLNPAGSTYNVYRQNAGCPNVPPTSTAGFTLLTSAAVPGFTYTDSTIVSGTYSYVVTAIVNGIETGPSPCGQGTVPVGGVPPQSISVTIK